MRAEPPGITAHSTPPLAVDRATNTTRERASARPEVVSYYEQVRERGFKISLRGVERFYVMYAKTYADDEGFLAYLMTYLDPTGETAVNEVLAERLAS